MLDLGKLQRLIDERILAKCDHRNLNEEVDFLRELIPSTENLAIAFWHELAPHLGANLRLERIRLYETERNYADYHGEPAS